MLNGDVREKRVQVAGEPLPILEKGRRDFGII
jgi:hypothetical protein